MADENAGSPWEAGRYEKLLKDPDFEVSTVEQDVAPATTVFRSVENKGEQARKIKQQADGSYKKALESIGPILEFVGANGYYLPQDLEGVLSMISSMVEEIDNGQLLETMQVLRIDRNVETSYYRYHTVNVALLNAMIGKLLKIEGMELQRLIRLGLVLDFGMLQLPEALLQRNRVLTESEKLEIRNHPQLTVQLLERSREGDKELIEAVLAHHERYNGSGYPSGLKGNAIPEIARISAISDAYDAAMSRKRYGRQKSPFEILAEFLENPGMQMDPSITRVMVSGFARMMVGRWVLLSDNSLAMVLEVDLNNLAYPVVKILKRRVQTGPELYPLQFAGHFPLYF